MNCPNCSATMKVERRHDPRKDDQLTLTHVIWCPEPTCAVWWHCQDPDKVKKEE